MKIKIGLNDTLSLIGGKIHALAGGIEYAFELSEIEEVIIITNDLGPFYDDMCLAIKMDGETAIFIMSEHPMYQAFLFDQLGKAVVIDYNKIIEASLCTENNIFVLYKRNDNT